MSNLPFGNLPIPEPRRFLPGSIDLGDWSVVAPFFGELERRLAACTDAAGLEAWLLSAGELQAALDEERARRYIAMTCNTEDATAEAAYLRFVEEVDPRLKPAAFQLARLFLEHPVRGDLDPERYRVYVRNLEVMVGLFREANVPLETEEARLGQQYQKLSGSLTVRFRGEEKTLVQMGRHLEETDRAVREEAWRLVAERRLREADTFESLFEAQLALREKIALNAGFGNYRDYAFRERCRFDYGPGDCEAFHDAIEGEVMPLIRRLHEDRRRHLGGTTLRPWDLAVDPLGRPPLRPFEEVEALERGVQGLFSRLDAGLADWFEGMRQRRLLDLANRKGKAPGGYQYTLSEVRQPFIFMNAVGQQRDVETLLHEAGHAFHALAARDEPLPAYRDAPIEFCEVASMSMELLGADHLDVFYPEADADRARQTHLEGVLEVFPWIAMVDAFQHWIYTHPGHDRAARRDAWLALMDRFDGGVDWSGLEPYRAALWHRQLHIFIHPFYYVEYGIAQLGALQVWARSRQDPVGALRAYKSALALGGSRPLPELFEAAGCRFDFSRGTVRPLIESVARALGMGA